MQYPKEAMIVEYAGQRYEIVGEPFPHPKTSSHGMLRLSCHCREQDRMHKWNVSLRPLDYVPQPGFETHTIVACYVFPLTPASRDMLAIARGAR